MISTQRIIYCINPDCHNPINSVGDSICASCQTPLVHRYLWATGSLAAKIPPITKVADRYEVITHQVWLDTQPRLSPNTPEELPQVVIPYLKLYQEHWHLPQAYGFAASEMEDATDSDILLLENVPIDETGNIYPTIADAWQQATAVRQVYWLWQILQLWQPLLEVGVAQSLLLPDNLRVQGWCVRLLELVETSQTTSLQQLGQSWQPWVASAKTSIAHELENICQQMCSAEIELDAIATQLNALLLLSAAELPLSIEVAGATDAGPALTQNEDTCYPLTSDLDDALMPRLSIVCDGIGGHQGGEVASQLAVQSLKLQIRALLAEVAEQTEVVSPKLLQEQIEASLRVVNNVICSRNDEQKRQGRERMATTLVMAVQIPQRVQTYSGSTLANAHELYLANIGDSRAYWITRNYCQLLTIDDDVATREVRLARSLYRKALQRPDATALTQALGTKDAEFMRLLVQRFIIEEDGILLLCSDGLSDNNWVEQSWQDYVMPVLTGKLSIEDAVRDLLNLANEKNGYDNASVVLSLYRVSPIYLVPVTPAQPLVEILKVEEPEVEQLEIEEPEVEELEAEQLEIEEPEVEEPEAELPQLEPASMAESSQALLDLDLDLTEEPTPPILVKKPNRHKSLVLVGGLLALLLGGTTLGLLAWSQLNPLNPQTFQQMCRQLPFCPQRK
ncbi:protein phosphatase 2C domain-containing protein [Nostocaceae cyanobacterium CENA369]|uniref:Protein phosphatase 2C domain-containing protein n=1 Tax=Dendronalium phyllosphericum CENA369 TaxID=1725256 RepID=A0A8J7II28_9NOST|nr:protein phosphatase 2C domain-containing protein [Dendronalium phyllosphericum]MBH8577536.1 protein phosphatase 2C domain-containing protein [Dendronalium phyllosphericum CENA369]